MIKHWTKDAWDAIKGDGCTGIPDLTMESPCMRHDRHYTSHVHRDGTPITRLEADLELAKDVWKMPIWTKEELSLKKIAIVPVRVVVKFIMPPILFIGVRLLGAPHWE